MAMNLPIYPPEQYEALTIDGGGFAEFDELFKQLRRRWVKVEFLQHYDETGSEAFEAHLRGEREKAAEMVSKGVKAQWVYDHARAHDVSMIRIRVYKVPLTDYLSGFEYFAYVADEEMGERVYALDWELAAGLIDQTRVSDYLIFDDRAVVALLYDEASGIVQEARLVTDGREVQAYVALTSGLLELAEPLRQSRFAALAEGRVS